jgi:hypothetical protein
MTLKIFAVLFLVLKTLCDIAVETAPLFKDILVVIATKVKFLFKEVSPVFRELVKELVKEFKNRKKLKKSLKK